MGGETVGLFPYADDNKRYHTLAWHNQKTYGKRMYKAAVNAGFTCPNIDGTCGTGGCLFCSDGSRYFAGGASLSITEQLRREIARLRAKDPSCGIIAYFQTNSNTYAPVEVLAEKYGEALSLPEVEGLSVATRPDCLPDDVVALLEEIAHRTALTVELGLQTVRDETAARVNRGHDYAAFLDGYGRLRRAGVRICVHLINGLPGETTEDMVVSAAAVGRLRPDAVKLHLLHVIEGTPLADLWRAGAYIPMELPAYMETVVRQLEVLPAETVIERLTGDGDKRTLLAPLWSRDKRRILGTIDKLLVSQDTWQGRYFTE